MALSFYLSNQQKQVDNSMGRAVFEIAFAKHMYEHPEKFPPAASFFLQLQPYEQELYSGGQLDTIAAAAKAILDTEFADTRLDDNLTLCDFHPFSSQLLHLCEQAKASEQSLLVISD